MEHGMDLHGGYVLLLIAAIIGVIILITVAAVFALHKEQTPKNSPSDVEPDQDTHTQTYSLEQQVLHFLRQKGYPPMQSEISNELMADQDDIARLLHQLEERELIERYWQKDQADYAVVIVEE